MSQVRTGAVPPVADGYVARPELGRALIDALFPGATAALVPAGAGGRGCYLDDFLARQLPDARSAALAWALAVEHADALVSDVATRGCG